MTRQQQVVKARASRFIDIAGVLVLLLSAVYMLDFWQRAKLINCLPTACLFWALTFLLTAILSTRVFGLVYRVRSLRFLFAYPSVSFISMFFFVAVMFFLQTSRINSYLIIRSLGVLLLAILIRALLEFVKTRLTTCPDGHDNQIQERNVPEDLEWIQREAPIKDIKADRFNHSDLVLRLASIVEHNFCRSFGLTGTHGSGKTSLLKMVEKELLKRDSRHWFVFVGGWGRHSSNISEYVLECIVRRLHDEGVEVLSLLSWPADYMREVMGDSSFLTRAFRCCLRSQHSSTEILQQLDPVLDCINRHIVVVVEDVDRNTLNDGMNTLCHLLDDFGKTRNVSFFFLKSEETKTGIDFHRLCEHTEMMPLIERDLLVSLLAQMIGDCKNKFPEKFLLHTERLDIQRLDVSCYIGDNIQDNNAFRAAICLLAHTPRSLKHALRRMWQIWQELAGEVDLLELLLWSLLREGCPVGYQFLRSNLHELRQLPTDIITEEHKAEPIRLVREKIKALDLTPTQEKALKVVLTLFGFKVSIHNEESYYVGTTVDHSRIGHNLPNALQSIALEGPTDYFRRLEAGMLGSKELPDQTTLHEIQQYSENRTGSLPDKVAQESIWAEKVVQFGGLLSSDRLIDLIEDHIEASGKLLGGRASDDSIGFMELRGIWIERSDARDKLCDRLESILLNALKHSMELAFSVYDWYVEKYETDIKLRIREQWIKKLEKLIEQDHNYLSNALNIDEPWGLYHTLRFRKEYLTYNTPQEWKWLAPHLIKAMKANPEKTVPDVSHLFIRDLRGARWKDEGPWFELETEYFENMCRTEKERAAITTLLMQYAEQHSQNDATAYRIQYVAKTLKQYCMKENGETENIVDE